MAAVFRNAIGLLLLLVVSSSYAVERRPHYPPAEHPAFQLVESQDESVVLRYTKLSDESLYRDESHIFVGIPNGATFSITPKFWNIAVYDNREQIDELVSTEPESASYTVKDILNSSVEIGPFQFYQLDGLKIEVDPLVNLPRNADGRYNRNKLAIKTLEFEIKWKEEVPHPSAEVAKVDAGMTRLYDNLFINAEQAQQFRSRRILPEEEKTQGFDTSILGYDFDSPLVNAAEQKPQTKTDRVRVRVRKPGITAIRARDIEIQGMDPSVVQMEKVRLWHRDKEKPLYVQDGDGVLGEGDAIYFYNPETESEYTNDRIYTLTWSERESEPLRIHKQPLQAAEPNTDTFPARAVLDSDNVLAQVKTNEYQWFLRSLTEKRSVFPIALPGSATGEVTLRIDMINKTRRNTDVLAHFSTIRETATVSVNNATQLEARNIAEHIRQDSRVVLALTEEPDSPTARSLSARVGDNPFIHVDRIEVVYPRSATEVNDAIVVDHDLLPEDMKQLPLKTHSRDPSFGAWIVKDNQLQELRVPESTQLNGVELPEGEWDQMILQADDRIQGPYTIDLVPVSTLHHPNQGYNYIIIANHLFMDEAQRLAKMRKQDGFQVLLVDVQTIYDEFNFGYPHSDAIKRFLRYAQSEWEGLSPEFVTLIGDSSWDHRDREGHDALDQVPTYAPVENPQYDGTDEWYAYLWGKEKDDYSDLLIGRISVRTASELSAFMDKLEWYENQSPVGPWKIRNLFITDDTFERYSRQSAKESLPPQLISKHIDQEEFPHVTNPYLYHRFATTSDPSMREYTNKKYCPECTLAILDGFDEGAMMVQYIGHGGNQIWSHERIFYGTDRPYSNVLELKPNTRFPFLVNWSCLTGYLNYNVPPFNVCMAEEFIRYRDKGAIAVWAPSGSSSTDQHMLMAHLLKRSLFQDGMDRVGESVAFTKLEYLQIQHHPQLLDQYILFGDPATKLALPTETLALDVSPKVMRPKETAHYRAATKVNSFDSGQVIVTLSIDGETAYQSKTLSFENSTIEHVFSLEHGEIDYATGKLGVYAWNQEQNLDAWGGAALEKFEPNIHLAQGNVVNNNGQPALEFSVVNSSKFDVDEVALELDFVESKEPFTVSDIPANATVTVEWTGAVLENSESVSIQLVDESLQPDFVRNSEAGVFIPLPTDQPVTVLPILGKKKFSSIDPIAGESTRLQIPILNQSDIQNATVEVALEGPSAATETKTIHLPPGQDRTADFKLTFPEMGEHTYQLHVESADEKQTYSFPVEVLGKPDLALAEGDFQVMPEIPVVGKTVRIRTTVYNVGFGPARDVSIMAYDGDPSLNRTLRPFNHRRQDGISVLQPGEMQEVEIVWDPESYEGQGVHEIHIVVDPYERIDETSERNNRIHFPMTLHGLPDLKVDPWNDHSMETKIENGMAHWGQPLDVEARVRNMGETAAEYVRVSILHNDDEISRFIDRIAPRSGTETETSVPLVSAKNTLRIHVDKYDLIGEKGETADSPGNNMSLEKRMYVDLIMPIAQLEENIRTYQVQSETQFAAGHAELLVYDKRYHQMIMHPGIDEHRIHLQPAYITNPDNYKLSRSPDKWQWSTKYNSFHSPVDRQVSLQARLPAPRGQFDVYAKLHSSADDVEGATGMVEYKTSADPDYVHLELDQKNAEDSFFKLGNYNIRDDHFYIDFRSVPNKHITSIGGILFERTGTRKPISTGYESAYFPSPGRTSKPVEMTWNAELPEGTELIVKGRWASYKEDKTLRYTPWMGNAMGEQEKLVLPGMGDFFQFYIDFIRNEEGDESPVVKNIEIKIPCQEPSG